MNNISTTNNIIEDTWNKAREQRDKLLEHYNKVIKPTLLDFYELTGEDINIKISLVVEENKNIDIIFKGEGQTIEYEVTRLHKCKSLMGANYHTIESIAAYINDIKVPNIKVIKVFSVHWDTIRAYMDTRISILAY